MDYASVDFPKNSYIWDVKYVFEICYEEKLNFLMIEL